MRPNHRRLGTHITYINHLHHELLFLCVCHSNEATDDIIEVDCIRLVDVKPPGDITVLVDVVTEHEAIGDYFALVLCDSVTVALGGVDVVLNTLNELIVTLIGMVDDVIVVLSL